MNPDFWHRRWQKNEIGFHENEGNTLLKAHFKQWKLPKDARVFVPMCGKTRDIAWLLSHGIEVVAIELNQSAIEALFQDLGVEPNISQISTEDAELTKYSVQDLTVYGGDFFALSTEHLGKVDGVYDRGALVAFPEELRSRYSKHLHHISQACSQFLITYDYNQQLFKGPPFSVTGNEVKQHYEKAYAIDMLYRDKIDGGFRGESEVFEAVYLLR